MAIRFRTIVISGLVLAGIGGAVWSAMQPEVVPVDLAVLERGALEVTVNADGQTRIRDVFEVSAPVSGMVLRSPVEIGDTVVAGETVVARIEPGEPAFLDDRARAQAEAAVAQAEAALTLARAEIKVAQADLANSQSQLERVSNLVERGTAPEAQLESAQVAVDISAAHLDSANANLAMRASQLEAAKAVLITPEAGRAPEANAACCTDLTAPISGRVLSVTNPSARMVMAGSPLLTIGPMEDLEITVDLLSTDAVRIKEGAPAYVERWGGEEALMARVREIEPAAFTKVSALGIEEQRVRVLLDFDEAGDLPPLGHGFRVYLRVVEWAGADVLRLPISALFREEGDWAVFVDAGGKAAVRRVEIGQRNADFAEVLSGLEPGEVVIAHPSDRVAQDVLIVDREKM
ncbi:MAG: RND transporter [Rhodobacterales bacterium]|nr:MAG: RND transporter [Rhodobacterales bacterium]